MPIRSFLILTIISLIGPTPGSIADEVAGLDIPDGFAVSEFAGSDLANDIQCLTIDPDGRVVVSGRGYIIILVDDDGDGRADRSEPFADAPKDGAMGLLWEGDSLFVVGDGGLHRYRDADGDDRADGPPELIRAVKTGGEHDAHAVRRGPDGWLYLILGNFAGVDASFASLPTSPIAEPVAGCLVRFSPDFSGSEIVADGFRNAYDFDFGPDGEIFTYDSDNERCVSLPWYEPTRLYHVVPGGHHGWLAPQRTETWRLPPEVEDVVPPVSAVDRGSPTGVVCYRHDAFPPRYRGGLFFLDWTFGRVYFARPERSGASFIAEPEVFLEASGTEGFAWTDVEVHPKSGELYLSIGGRGTRGAVYRVRFEGDAGASAARDAPETGDRPSQDSAPPPTPPRLLTTDRDPILPPGAVPERVGTDRLLAAASSDDSLQRLRALVELKRRHEAIAPETLIEAIRSNWDHADRLVRSASADLIAVLSPDQRSPLADDATTPVRRATLGFGIAAEDPEAALDLASRVLADPEAGPGPRLAAIRLVQVALGGQPDLALEGTVWEGYSPRFRPPALGVTAIVDKIGNHLVKMSSVNDSALDRERSRTLAVIESADPDALLQISSRLTAASDPVDDLHHLIVLGRLRGPRPPEVTSRVADALLALDRKLDARAARRDRNWPLRVSELCRGLGVRDAALASAVLAHPEFGRPDHALLALALRLDPAAAADRMLDRAGADPDYSWTPDVVAMVGARPSVRAINALRALWGSAGLDDAILPVLARDPSPEDRPKFVSGLRSAQPSTVSAALAALDAIGPSDDPAEWLALILALRRSAEPGQQRAIADLLSRSTRQAIGPDANAWASWFASADPDRAAALSGGDGVDAAAWARRLAGIDWSLGDAGRGLDVFRRAQCASCHSGNRAVGPDLAGVAGRFSREDLFTAIIQPSRDVADRYRSALVATDDGQIHQGIIIYDAVDRLILQAGATETIQLHPDSIERRQPLDQSLMPAGLLDELTDRDIADLDAYLRSLGSASAR
ncbi:DUF7133 domain-containing protein [Tautonia sociabilis]|uniref:Cytochrome c domain-containing protein n=1 Tax=Tautonia sociabilis TaxID=2080755 RepID=A0A432MEW4_9BACT|nr:hypothetical protein [Tautonia sociabilis]RUL84222.1 hypothetical protein TsocGM_20750 [Tautonia sociabilis]